MGYDLKKAFNISRSIAKRQTGELSGSDSRILDEWISESSQNKELYDRIVAGGHKEGFRKWKQTDHRAPLHRMNMRIAARRTIRQRTIAIAGVCAGIAACVLVILTLVFPRDTAPINIYPGDTRATLVMSSGEVRDLDASSNMYINEAGVAIAKGDHTSLSYNIADGKRVAEEPVYHEIRIGRGGEFDLELSDGTHVWLNSESSLRYPISFTGESRMVYLTGEAYFEVAKDSAKPFVVESSQQTVTVLGTSFNINAYANSDRVFTTLVSGSVSVAGIDGEQVVLSPGEQSQTLTDGTISVSQVDIVNALAWRTGWFILDNQTLEQFMTQISRWYDFETVYVNERVRAMEFIGKVPRYGDFDQVLNVLRQSSELKISVKDNKVYIE